MFPVLRLLAQRLGVWVIALIGFSMLIFAIARIIPGDPARIARGLTFNCPAEVAEARYGLEVVERRLNLPPVSPGSHTGGPGVVTRYRMTGDAVLSADLSHATEPVWSLSAVPGGTNRLKDSGAARPETTHQFVSGLHLGPGDEVEIQTAYGGSEKASGP